MAKSPTHALGQAIGHFIEQQFEEELTEICTSRGLYLDVNGKERKARGKKLTWVDEFGNKHDLDFVIERGGSDDKIGIPAALIECAWRRYTKHSKAKAQEMQGAVLPVADHHWVHKPFLGAVLAGDYSAPSVEQLNSHGFCTLHFLYEDVVEEFREIGVEIRTDESSSDEQAQAGLDQMQALTDVQKKDVFDRILKRYEMEVVDFKNKLIFALDRQVQQVIVAPLYGADVMFSTVRDAMSFIESFSQEDAPDNPRFVKITVQVKYGNGDSVSGDFSTKTAAAEFLQRVI